VRPARISTWWMSVLLTSALAGAETPPDRARLLFERTDYEAALSVLSAIPDKNAAVYQWAGRCHYMLGDFKKASADFERAVAAEPLSAVNRLWLGRAYGRRAETSNFITAPGYASKARQNFEEAVRLDPRNLEAASDLFEYYLEAPGFLGGGLEKAAALAQRIKELDPAEYYYLQARLAEKQKQFHTAENELRRAMEAAPKQVGRVLDLAKFLAKQGRWDESEEAFRQARKLAPDSPTVLFEQASTYIRGGRNLETARELLKRYLESPLTPDDPPRRAAEQLLRQLSGI